MNLTICFRRKTMFSFGNFRSSATIIRSILKMPRGIYERTSIKRGKYSRYSQTDKDTIIKAFNDEKEDYFLNICVNTVKNWLDGELISLKNVRCHPGTMNGNNNKRLRSIYVENIMRDRANERNLVWVDETNFNLYCRRKERRSKSGCRATVIQTASKGANLHCIGAMTSSRLVKVDSFTSESCKAWMRELINTCREEGIEKPTIINDNSPAHSNVESILGPNEDVKITRLAPYSYLINPIDLLWSSFKASVKMILRDQMPSIIQFNRTNANMTIGEYRMQKLEAAAKEAIQQSLPCHFASYAAHVEIYYPGVVREENTLNKNNKMVSSYNCCSVIVYVFIFSSQDMK